MTDPTLRERLERFRPDDEDPSVVEFADLVRDIEVLTPPSSLDEFVLADVLFRLQKQRALTVNSPVDDGSAWLAKWIAAEYARLAEQDVVESNK